MVTNPRTLHAMVRQGYIRWEDGEERHWTGIPVRRRWVQPGDKLLNWGTPFRYRGRMYQLGYVGGYFHPFVFRVGERRPQWV